MGSHRETSLLFSSWQSFKYRKASLTELRKPYLKPAHSRTRVRFIVISLDSATHSSSKWASISQHRAVCDLAEYNLSPISPRRVRLSFAQLLPAFSTSFADVSQPYISQPSFWSVRNPRRTVYCREALARGNTTLKGCLWPYPTESASPFGTPMIQSIHQSINQHNAWHTCDHCSIDPPVPFQRSFTNETP